MELFATLSSTSVSIGPGVSPTSGKCKFATQNIGSIERGETGKPGLLFYCGYYVPYLSEHGLRPSIRLKTAKLAQG